MNNQIENNRKKKELPDRIPKVIHYIWLSGSPKERTARKCIATWRKKLPDYEIREWTAADFHEDELPVFVREAIGKKKWAFAADYLRLYVLYRYGGIYLDSDVYVRKSFDGFLGHSFFSFMEVHGDEWKTLVDEKGFSKSEEYVPGCCIQAAILGAEPGHPLVKNCMSYYEKHHFVDENGNPMISMIAPDIYALHAREYGFRYVDAQQNLKEGIVIYPSRYAAGSVREIKNECYAAHLCAGSWRNQSWYRRLRNKMALQWGIIRLRWLPATQTGDI